MDPSSVVDLKKLSELILSLLLVFLFVFMQIFGFLNLILWAGNCWFIYKETPFHKDPLPPATVEEGGVPGP